MKIEKLVVDEIPVLKLLENFDTLAAYKVQKEINDFIVKRQSLILDLSALNFLDSTAIGIIVKSTFALAGLNANLAIIPNTKILEMFKFNYLSNLLNIFEDIKSAVDFLK